MLSPDEIAALSDLERRLANVVRLGVVAEVDIESTRCRVRYDVDADGEPVSTDWLPWLTRRAGVDRAWWAPSEGEQVALLAPGGELTRAVVLPGLFSAAHPAPDDSALSDATLYADGARVEYDRDAHRYSVTVPAGGEIMLTVGTRRIRLTGNRLYHEIV